MENSTMLGTFTLDNDVPVEPEIVLANCQNTDMLGQLVGMFQSDPDIRFFLVQDVNENAIDLATDSFFLKDGGNWVLANSNTLFPVLFDDTSFNPNGTEHSFSLLPDGRGGYTVATDHMPVMDGDMPAEAGLLVDPGEDSLFVHDVPVADHPAESFFIDPSALGDGQNEIVIHNFTMGNDTLEMPDNMAIKDIVLDHEHDLTQVVIGQADDQGQDIVVKLMGAHQSAFADNDYAPDTDASSEHIINHLIHSGDSVG